MDDENNDNGKPYEQMDDLEVPCCFLVWCLDFATFAGWGSQKRRQCADSWGTGTIFVISFGRGGVTRWTNLMWCHYNFKRQKNQKIPPSSIFYFGHLAEILLEGFKNHGLKIWNLVESEWISGGSFEMLEDQLFDRKMHFLKQQSKGCWLVTTGESWDTFRRPGTNRKLLLPTMTSWGTSASRNMKLVASWLGKSSSNLLLKMHPSPRSWDGHLNSRCPSKSKLWTIRAGIRGSFTRRILRSDFCGSKTLGDGSHWYRIHRLHSLKTDISSEKIVVGRPLHLLGLLLYDPLKGCWWPPGWIKRSRLESPTYLPGTPNNQFFMDVWWNNHFLYKGLESSNWNNNL